MATTPCKPAAALTDEELDKAVDQETIRNLWQYAKTNYVGKGIPVDEAAEDMAKVFPQWTPRQIAYLLDKPKSLRTVTTEMRQRMRETNRFLRANQEYLESFDQTGVEKLYHALMNGTRGSLLTAHGPVVTQIHAIDTLFTNPGKFLRAVARGVMSLDEKNVDRYMAKMTDTPERAAFYKMMVERGAPISKAQTGDWVTYQGLLYKLGTKYDIKFLQERSWAAKATDGALKPLRFELMWDQWNRAGFLNKAVTGAAKASDIQTPQMADFIAEQYSHATGAAATNEKAWRNVGFLKAWQLAPMKNFAVWMKTAVDPVKTGRTWYQLGQSKGVLPGGKIAPPSSAELMSAWSRTKRAGVFLGVYMGGLAVNDAILKGTGSNQRVNFWNPGRSDWLAYKGFGHYWRPRGSLEVAALFGHIFYNMSPYQKQTYGKDPESVMGRYAEYKLLPGISMSLTAVSGRDVFGRPVPWSSQQGTPKFPKLQWPEFAAQRGPIFIGHAVTAAYDGMRQQGVQDPTIKQVLNAMTQHPEVLVETAAVMGTEFFGINMQKDLYAGREAGMTSPTRTRHR